MNAAPCTQRRSGNASCLFSISLISKVEGGLFALACPEGSAREMGSEPSLSLDRLNGLRKALKEQYGDFRVCRVHALPRAVTLSKSPCCPCLPSLRVNEDINISFSWLELIREGVPQYPARWHGSRHFRSRAPCPEMILGTPSQGIRSWGSPGLRSVSS